MRNCSITLVACLLLRSILFAPLATCSKEEFTIDHDGAATVSELGPDLFFASSWTHLSYVGRAELYLAAVGAGKLDEDSYSLIPAAQVITTGEFEYGGGNNRLVSVRGAMAIADIPGPSDICAIGENAVIGLTSVVRKLMRKYGKDATVSAEIDSIPDLVQTPADERSLVALLVLREASRTSSPLMPYITTFLQGAHEHIPSAWDPASAEGAARLAGLEGVDGGKTLVAAADVLRKTIARDFNDLAPRAIEKLPNLLGLTGSDIVDVTRVYAFQKFAEIWLAIRSRSVENGGYGVLVPLLCMMNHPMEGEESNIELRIDSETGGMVLRAKRHIKRGEQLTFSYGDLTAERALLVYGFPMSVWSKLPKGFPSE